jgi:hypothetical protein
LLAPFIFPAAAAARYPWDEWLDGSQVIQGEDFQSKTSALRANAQIQAKKRNGRIRSRALKANGHEKPVLQFEPAAA